MSTAERVNKLDGHAAALLDSYRGLRQTFALLEPLLPSASVSQALGNGPSHEGLSALRQSLFLACALDVTKLCLDTDVRTPSVANLLKALDEPDVVEFLRSRAAQYCLPRDPGDKAYDASLDEIERREREARAKAFDDRLAAVRAGWTGLETSLKSFATMRDKYIAHLELRCSNGVYAPIDLAALGLKWSDLGEAIAAMEPLVAGLSAVIRSADFDMSAAVRHFEKVRDNFWSWAR